MIFNSLIPTVFIGDTLVSINAFFRLQDNITNGHFSPKKQALIEDKDMFFSCSPYDLKEDVEKGKTDYYCKDILFLLYEELLTTPIIIITPQ